MVRTRTSKTGIVPRGSVPDLVITDYAGKVVSTSYWPRFSDLTSLTSTCTDETHPGPPYRTGGNLGIIHSEMPTESLLQLKLKRAETMSYYLVDFRPTGLTTCPINITTLGDAEQYGATGWKRFKPGKTGATMGQFLGELRDLPKLFKLQAKSFRDIGGSYLNYQFGWKPFMSDLKSFFDLTKNLDRRFQFLKRNNNKFKKRGGTILEENNTEVVPSSTFPASPVLQGGFYPNWTFSHTTKVSTTVTRKAWFEALMRYYIPDINSPARYLTEVVRQFGLMPSPSLVYELTPWSWLIDYFSNLGDVIDNLSDSQAAPNLVALYAYVMNTTIITRKWDTSFNILMEYNKPLTVRPVTLSFSQSWVSKKRAAASPFGFNFMPDALSDYQLSILSAIGISRFPKIR